MQIDHPVREAVEERAREDAHEPCQHDEIRPRCFDDVGQGSVTRRTVGMVGLTDNRRVDSRIGCSRESRGAGCRRDHQDDFCRLIRGNVKLIDDGLKIPARAGDQDGQAERARHERSHRSRSGSHQ